MRRRAPGSESRQRSSSTHPPDPGASSGHGPPAQVTTRSWLPRFHEIVSTPARGPWDELFSLPRFLTTHGVEDILRPKNPLHARIHPPPCRVTSPSMTTEAR